MPLLALLALATAPAASAPRCTVQQVHTPAGKMVHNAPIVRCERLVARQTERPVVPSAGGSERAR